jgi:hypothetical protein
VTRRGPLAAGAFALLVLVGSWLDRDVRGLAAATGVLVADLHVHPFPGDGTLPVSQLQREARRRGIDVIAVAGHNNRVALGLAHALGLASDEAIVLESQELTAPDFHMIAVGVRKMIDSRLSVTEAVEAIHAQGGLAIAAHPVPLTWKPQDEESLRGLDGVEVAHPMTATFPSARRQLDEFFERVRAVNPEVAPIGSTDFHATAPLGLCRTYLITGDRSAAGAVEAIRRGRTVAADADGRLFGTAEHVAVVEERLATGRMAGKSVSLLDKLVGLGALLSLAILVMNHVPHHQRRPSRMP